MCISDCEVSGGLAIIILDFWVSPTVEQGLGGFGITKDHRVHESGYTFIRTMIQFGARLNEKVEDL